MFIWDYVEKQDGTIDLTVSKFDKGVRHKVTKSNLVCSKALFWLKHYERLDIDAFALEANLEATLEESLDS